MNPVFLIDFYKIGHVLQYPKGITHVWSNWTPRSTHVKGETTVVNAGLTYFLKKYLIEEFDRFFEMPLSAGLSSYREVVKECLGVENPYTEHIEALHGLGFLPLAIHALPEGVSVPLRVPTAVLTNTEPSAFWLPNYLETIFSAGNWKMATSASTALRYRKLFTKHALEFGETNLGFVDWMGHDFSMRGMSGLEDAIMSGMGHLLSFSGTDTVPAILAARRYYGASLSCGGSVPATEHSVMQAGLQDGEFETFKRLLTDIYQAGIVSIVSDTWDLWKVLTDYIPRLRGLLYAREGKIVIRPDSGDPVKIICGDPQATEEAPRKGAARLLAEAMGTDGDGHITKAGLIYGDSITVERADAILTGLRAQGLSPYNMVFGIGSYTYEMVTRDTYGWAMKATAVRRDGKIIPIFKKPVTDDGMKFSARGILSVHECQSHDGHYVLREGEDDTDLASCAFQKVFENGKLLVSPTFDEIRRRVRNAVQCVPVESAVR